MHYIFKLLIFLVCDILYKKLLKAVIMNIGNLHIDGFAALAPMAGVADRAFRENLQRLRCRFYRERNDKCQSTFHGRQKNHTSLCI